MKTMRFALVSLLLITLLIAPLAALAQDLTQTFTARDSAFTFDYPADWIAEDLMGTVIVANTQAAMDAFFAGQAFAGDQVLLAILTPAALSEELGGFGDMDESAVLSQAMEGDLGAVQTDTLGDKPVAMGVAVDSGETTVAYVVNFGAGGFALVLQVSVSGQETTFEPTTRAIIASMAAGDLPPADAVTEDVPATTDPIGSTADVAVTGGTVVWQQIFGRDSAAISIYVEKLVVGPSDTVYVLDTSAGVYMFDADGQRLGVVTPDNTVGNLLAFDVADDGTLWVVGFFGEIVHLDTDGATLTSFDLTGMTELAYFGIDLAIGPEGNLYLLNPREDENGGIGEVLVFSPEGELLKTFVLGTDEYFYEASMVFGPDGMLYVAEYFGKQGIRVFDTDGNLLREGIGAADLYNIVAVAVGGDGTIFASISDSPIFYYANDGTLLGEFGASMWYQDNFDFDADVTPPPAPGIFYDISSLGVFSNGDVVVVDASGDWWQLVRFSFGE